MYKVLLVDDEYMITEGLKKLIPFEKWDMEVVYTAEDADQALAYVADYPVDIVITDVNMPGKTGLEMIDQMQSILPHAAYIIMSGYQDFDYVKKALNLRVADYLLKPVNKVELGNILEKLSQTLKKPDQETANRLLHEDWSEEEFEQAIRGRKQLWIGVDKERKGKALPVRLIRSWDKIFNSIFHMRMRGLSYSVVSKHLIRNIFNNLKSLLNEVYFMGISLWKKKMASLITTNPSTVSSSRGISNRF